MRRLFVLVAVLILVLALGTTAFAITGGQPDGEAHPYVGMLIFDDANGPAWRCSGTLIEPTVVLTAGHCVDGATAARIWFDSDLTSNAEYPFGGSTSIEGTPIENPAYGQGFPNTGDIGLVILDTPVTDRGYGSLIAPGIIDELATRRGHQDLIFRPVGYGLQSVVPDLMANRVRYTAISRLGNLRNSLTRGYNIQLVEEAGGGNDTGGTCFGDSGGPIFYPENSNQIAAVVSFGLNQNCVGVGFHYRVDSDAARAFLSGYVPVP